MEVLQRTANRGSVSTGYDIDNSLKFERANGEQVYTSNQAVGNKKTWTFSAWLKRTQLGQDYSCVFGSGYTNIQFMDNDKLRVVLYDGSNSRYADTDQVFRDTSAFYHIVIALDSTQGTASDRVKIYINGVRVTSFSNTTYTNMSQNDEFGLGYAGSDGSERWIRLGEFFGGSEGFSGYMSDVYYLNGTAEDADAFGEYDDDSGIWIPKKYTGSGYGTQGFKYEFKDSSALGTDTSGEGHNANNLGNITAADQATDTPTNNFCTYNPLMIQSNSPTISEGAMKSTGGGGTWNQTWGNMGVKNGKWYYEMKCTNVSYSGLIGASTAPAEGSNTTAASFMYNTSVAAGNPARVDYSTWINGSQVSNESTGWGSFGVNDIIGVALDLDAATKTITFYKNGTALSGTTANPVNLPTEMQDEFIFPLYVQYENRYDEVNFGGYTVMSISSAASDANGYGTFEYAPPTGYYALCTKNLAEYG